MSSSDPWSPYILGDVNSTMDEARERIKEAPSNCPFYVQAESQSKGRGRHKRSWQSPKGNLYVTLCFHISDFKQAPFYSYVTAIALLKTLRGLNIDHEDLFSLKWPNDILMNSKKMAGVLLEIETIGDDSYLLIGIGVNITSHPQDTPYPATNLSSVITSPPSAPQLLESFLSKFDTTQQTFLKEGFEPLRQTWLSLRDKAHDHIVLKNTAGEITDEGHFMDLDQDGFLVLKRKTGDIKKIATGDVFFAK